MLFLFIQLVATIYLHMQDKNILCALSKFSYSTARIECIQGPPQAAIRPGGKLASEWLPGIPAADMQGSMSGSMSGASPGSTLSIDVREIPA